MAFQGYFKSALNRARRVHGRLVRSLYIDRGRDYRQALVVAGTERSGTTWLADLVNCRRDHRLMFEPFWNRKVPECDAVRPQLYLRADAHAPEVEAVVRRVLCGDLRNAWVDQYHRAYFTSRRIVKDVRINLMLGWIKRNFPDVPIVLIIRHPCAVATSQIKAGHRFAGLRQSMLCQQDLMDDHLRDILDNVTWQEGEFSEYVLRWCIQNYVPLEQLRAGIDMHVVLYEELCTNPQAELARLFRFLGWPEIGGAMRALRVPSPVSRLESPIRVGGSLVDAWTQYVTAEQAAAAADILECFGLRRLYSTDPLPQPGAREQLGARGVAA